MVAETSIAKAFTLKGRLYTLTVLQLCTTEKEIIEHQIVYLIEKAPKMLKFAPIVIDLAKVCINAKQFVSIIRLLRQYDLIPVAIQNASEVIRQQSIEIGIAQVSATTSQDKQVTVEKQVGTPAKIINTPVRSGQQIYAKNCDLIVIGSVSHGAELLADGNIHVYGALRGRALAGIQGNNDSRIFCQELEAELLSIAGHYVLNETANEVKGPSQVYLQNEKIMIDSL